MEGSVMRHLLREQGYIRYTLKCGIHWCSCVFTANSVVKNRRPQLQKPAGSHSSYLVLRGQTLTLECIPEGL